MHHLRTLVSGLCGAALLAALAAPSAVSAQTLDRIKRSGLITLGYLEGASPMSARSADGSVTGFGTELCRAVADAVKARLGLPALDLRFVPVKADDALDKVAQGGVDLFCTPTAETLKRRETVSYTIPVFKGGIGAIVRKDADPALRAALSGQPVRTGPVWRGSRNGGIVNVTYAVRKGSVTEDWVREKVQQLGIAFNAIVVDDEAKGLQLVEARVADVYFSERALLADHVARNAGRTPLVVIDRRFEVEMLGLALARNDDDFRLLVDASLSRLFATQEFPALYAGHFGAMSDAVKAAYLEFALR